MKRASTIAVIALLDKIAAPWISKWSILRQPGSQEPEVRTREDAIFAIATTILRSHTESIKTRDSIVMQGKGSFCMQNLHHKILLYI